MISLTQVWGALLIFVLCPLLGGIPITGWIVQFLTGKRLTDIGTGNIGVSAAFYHGGTAVGLLAVTAEAAKGIAAVLLAQHFFPVDPLWPVVALISLVMGRYWMGRSAGVTNVSWGFLVYDPFVAGLTFLVSLISFTLVRERKQGRMLALILLPVLTALRHGDGMRIVAVACLSGIIAWIYQKLPDDLDLPAQGARVESQRFFQFFRREGALKSLAQVLSPDQVGAKAATLSQLKAWGYPVPMGYVIQSGDDPTNLIAMTQPSPDHPVVARSSAIGEDSITASSAGQYVSVANVTSQRQLENAIATCFNAYNSPSAIRYRQDKGLPEIGMNVLVQEQIQGVYSGVAFSRDPIVRSGEAVVVEALPGGAAQVVSGQVTPQQYRVLVTDSDVQPGDSWQLPDVLALEVHGPGDIPTRLIQQVAFLTRHLEQTFHDVPQDVEWSFDGEQLWVLQSRPITTLLPIWTRKIAAEVIPGTIRPLTWSINRPLTCGVWGEFFSQVLGKRAQGIDFEETATLHHSQAYFNASLLGDIFIRMGLPAKSLEFLTRGAKFQKPPLKATLQNLPGLLRLARQEWTVKQDYNRDAKQIFQPGLVALAAVDPAQLSPQEMAQRIETILALLKKITAYNILAPLSLALRQAILKVDNRHLNYQANAEITAIESLKTLAIKMRPLVEQFEANFEPSSEAGSDLWARLAADPAGEPILAMLETYLETYGYLSEVATDIAIPTWQENSQPVKALLLDLLFAPNESRVPSPPAQGNRSWKVRQVQARLDLKGQVNEVYNRLLAALRACFVIQEQHWLSQGVLTDPGDIFFLTWSEIKTQLTAVTSADRLPPETSVKTVLMARKQDWEADAQLKQFPYLVYGNAPPRTFQRLSQAPPRSGMIQGIGASPGQVEGEIRILNSLNGPVEIDSHTILVVPYTDAGWAPLLARTGGLIAEVGGQLSHGAIVAREYGIPAVMDVTDATHRLVNGQRVRINGQDGTIEFL